MVKLLLFVSVLLYSFTGLFSQQASQVQTAYNALKSKNYDVAIKQYSSVIDTKNDYAPAYYGRGIAYYHLNSFNQSLIDLNKAVALDKGLKDLFYARGLTNTKLNNLANAIEDLTKHLEASPNFAEAYYARGNAYYYLEEDNKALEDYSKAITIQPNYAPAYYGRAIIYKIMKKSDLALRDFDKYLELAGKNAPLSAEVVRLIDETLIVE